MSRRSSTWLIARNLHPGAWWVWALGLAAAASRTTNPLVLVGVLGVAATVVTARRTDAPWARSFAVFLKLGLVVIAIRVIAQTIFGTNVPGDELLTLPEVPLPAWAAGVTLGGPITDLALANALVDGLRLATVLACIGAANALANPKRLLASAPAALYELGVAVVVALSFAPSLVASVSRIRAARRLRGRTDRGLRSIVGVAMPVLEDALERSLALAAAMDSRGYGRRAGVAPRRRRATATLSLVGLGSVLIGLYNVLDASGPVLLGAPLLALGLAVATVSLALAGREVSRTRYRPDPFALPEWTTVGAGLTLATSVIVAGSLDPAALQPTPLPLAALPLPGLVVLGLVAGALPAVLTPPPVRPPTRDERRSTDRDPAPVSPPRSEPTPVAARSQPDAGRTDRSPEVAR